MRIRSIPLFLLGQREAILELAHSRWTLPIGALLVLSAALARNYDGEDLTREPWYLVGPFAASIATSLGLFVLLLILARVRDRRRTRVWAKWRLYPRFLSLYWMTAPLAWLYGIPYERFMTPAAAIEANMWTLGMVATWRVILMARVISLLLRTKFLPMFVWTAFYGAALMIAAVLISPKPILDIMGGLHLAPEDRLLTAMMFNLGFFSLIAIPLLLIAGAVLLSRFSPLWPPPGSEIPHRSAFVALLVATVAVVIWIPALTVGQPEQRLRRSVELAMQRGGEADAVAIMSAHSLSDFPPHWRPPPVRGWRNSPGSLAKIRAAIESQGAREWVLAHYVEESRVRTRGPFRYRWNDEVGTWADALETWVESFKPNPTGAIKSDEAIRFLLRHDATISAEQRARIEAILSRPGFVSPNGEDWDW